MKSFRLTRELDLTPEQRRRRLHENKKAVIITAIILFTLFLWTRGTFDNFLWRVHLNHDTCATNGFGATFCGDDLKRYENRLRDAGLNP